MKIKTKLTLQNTCVTAAVFLLCMVLIYLVSEHTRSRTFFHDLKSEAVTKAHLFLQNQVDAQTMQSIYLNNKKFINEVEVAVYSIDFRMLYHDAIQNDIIKEDHAMVDRILKKKEMEFYIGKYQAIGMLYSFGGKDYIVTAAAYDGYGYGNLFELQKTLLILFVVGLSLLFVAGYFLARASLKPIRDIVREAETITALHINRRLPVKNEKMNWENLVLLLMPCWSGWKYHSTLKRCLSAMCRMRYVHHLQRSLPSWICRCKKNGPVNSTDRQCKMYCKMPDG